MLYKYFVFTGQSLQLFDRGLYFDLFCFLCINVSSLCNRFSKVALLADDCECSNICLSRKSCIILQSGIDLMYKLSQLWQMDFNVITCYIISFAKAKSFILCNYNINGVPFKE